MVHFPPAVDELLDCKYEWCGRTGAHGFKREDLRKDHYRKVHNEGSRARAYPKKSGRRNITKGREHERTLKDLTGGSEVE